MQNAEDTRRYPIGPFQKPILMDVQTIINAIDEISHLPELLATKTANLNQEQLELQYREDGWTVRQVIHHIADSHLMAYTRCRLALTEDTPIIKSYNEVLWADLPDARYAPVESSVQIVQAVHNRWVYLLRSLPIDDLEKPFYHPEYRKNFSIKDVIVLYAWHGKHHVAQIETALRG
ncbi:MAG: putative metal-dependent hydrolase [Ignavibacteria bacterium]|nr:putative metal-dependent hydrolase [Ignavibacteria bacterium]